MHKIMFARVEVWVLLLVILFLSVGIILFGGRVLYKAKGANALDPSGSLTIQIAQIPLSAKELMRTGVSFDLEKGVTQRNPNLRDHDFIDDGEQSDLLTRYDEDFNDEGYILASAFSSTHDIPIVLLFDIKNERIVWEWIPSPETIVASIPPAG